MKAARHPVATASRIRRREARGGPGLTLGSSALKTAVNRVCPADSRGLVEEEGGSGRIIRDVQAALNRRRGTDDEG
jgi:hypothetical protein